ncbi:hypothetical protein ACRAWF_02505 [Streptomyces sp. L7]
MLDRRSLLRNSGAATPGALALTPVAGGTDLAVAAEHHPDLFGDPASTPRQVAVARASHHRRVPQSQDLRRARTSRSTPARSGTVW